MGTFLKKTNVKSGYTGVTTFEEIGTIFGGGTRNHFGESGYAIL